MTGEEWAQLGATVHAAVVSIIKSVVEPAAIVLDRDPMNFNEALWFGALKSDGDVDENDDKRVHAWVVKFGGSLDPHSSTVRSIEPLLIFPVEYFYSHDFGIAADNSEKRMREEILKVQWALAENPKLGGIVGVRRHGNLGMRMRLTPTRSRQVLHRGSGELSVELQPAYVG